MNTLHPMELLRKKSNSCLASLLLVFALSQCSFQDAGTSNKHAQKNESSPTSSIHDPYSAPLKAFGSEITAPPFSLNLISDESFNLEDEIDKVIVLNVWATWCAPCLKETPDLIEIYENYGAENVQILGVSIDEQGLDVVQPFVEKFQIPYPIALDQDGLIEDLYGPVMGIPSTFIIDQKGILRFHAVGAVTKRELSLRLEDLLGE
mgnify:CR=1 FL=1